MDITIETITPKKAREYLKNNPDNRNLRRTRVEAYARDMQRKAWMENGAAICFNAAGELVDGQHRMAACIEAGMPFKSVVARGIEREARVTMDVGATRSFADVLKFMGYQNVHQLAASIRWGWMYDNECLTRRTPATNTDLLQWMSENMEIVDAVHQTRKAGKNPFRCTETIYSIIILRTSAKMPGEALSFIDQLRTGAGLDAGNPIFELRRVLEFNNINTKKMQPLMVHAIIIKAWNAWIEGREIKILSYKPGGTKREAFPVIVTEH